MAKTYTSTLQIRCWKHHKCVGCEGNYAYEFVRTIKGTGGTAEKASIKAKANAEKALKSDTDFHPCPTCGLYQPDMIGQRRAKRSWIVFWCALIAFIITVILAVSHGVQFYTLTWVTAAICAVAAGAHSMTSLWNPNSNLSANLTRAEGHVASGKILSRPGLPAPDVKQLASPSKSPFHLLILLLLAAAVVAAVMPEIVRTSKHWPLNPDAYPPVVGPGDETRIYMQDKIESIKSYWRGQAVAQLREGGRSYPVSTTTNQNDWGSTIYAKSSEKHSTSSPWVGVTVPANPALAGKVVDCGIKLAVQYPHANGSGTFEVPSTVMQRTVRLTLAPPGAGESYISQWWQDTLTAMGIVLFCSVALVFIARAFQRRAHPTGVFNADGTPQR
jgi:hypothetical protein